MRLLPTAKLSGVTAHAACAYTSAKCRREFGGGCHRDYASGGVMDLEGASGRAAPARLVGRAREEALCLFLADILQLRDEDLFDGCG